MKELVDVAEQIAAKLIARKETIAVAESSTGGLISAALLHDPDVLILDEPLSGIDVTSALLFKHLLNELTRRGKMILYISHVLEVVEKVCAQVIIIYKGRIMAADSVERLRDLTKVPSLEEIFSQLVEHRDLESVARDIACAIQR